MGIQPKGKSQKLENERTCEESTLMRKSTWRQKKYTYGKKESHDGRGGKGW